MALSTRHVVGATALVCLGIAVAQLPPPPDPVETRFAPPRELAPSRRRVLLLEAELAAARRQLDAASGRSRRMNALIAAARPGESPVLITEVPLSSAVRDAVEQRLHNVWQRLGRPSPDVGVVLVITASGRPTHTLPAVTGGPCIIELPLGWRVRWLRLSSDVPPRIGEIDDWLIDAVGPCGFYATFGRPGSHIEHWLLSRSFDLGWTSWIAPHPPQPLPAEALLRLLVPVAWGGDDRYTALDAVACNAGALDRCRAALFTPRPRAPRGDRQPAPGIVTRSWRAVPTLYDADRYLADLTRAIGPERFAEFWRSSLPVAEAFAHAVEGERTIEQWTAGWQRERMGQLRVGPAVRLPSVLLGLLAAGMCVGAVALWAGRRQVG